MPGRDPSPALAAGLLGFALSGFFDGILLHQILQWHHLLSALGGDLRWQVAADGWFHMGMYAVAAVGLGALWRARHRLGKAGAGRAVVAWGLIGFGAWHALDAVGSHWLLGIHRIRMDVADPLVWDIGWLVAFGLVPLALGWRLMTVNAGRGGGGAAALLAVLTVAAGGLALRPPPGGAHAVIAFSSRVAPGQALDAALASGGRLVWSDGSGIVVVTRVAFRDLPQLYARGALFVGGVAGPMGCLGWRV
jgi:uncharacterized membrane protein